MQPDLTSFLQELLHDPNVYLLRDRQQPSTWPTRLAALFHGGESTGSIMQYQDLCASMAEQWWRRLQDQRLPVMRFHNSPHSLNTYIAGRTAEYLGIPCYMRFESRVPGFELLGQGLGRRPRLVPNGNEDAHEEFRRQATQFIARVKSTYEAAMPEYEKVRRNANRGRHFSIRTQIKRHAIRPSYVVNGYRCWKRLSKVTKAGREPRGEYVVFFLHYQPERTSLPEGYGFAQQSLAIRALREALPAEVTLLVREHPSTFTGECVPSVRWPEFYSKIGNGHGVQWGDVDEDPFSVVDGAIATATLTGTVATESVLRGVPSIVFGVRKWPPCAGQHYYRDQSALKEFVGVVLEGALSRQEVEVAAVSTIMNEEARFAFQVGADFDETILRDSERHRAGC